MIVAFSSVSDIQVRLPSGSDNTSLLNIIIYIRDKLDSSAEYNISSITVVSDAQGIIQLINILQNPTNSPSSNSIIQLLAIENQNIVGQMITSLSQQLNKMNIESIENAILNGISATSIFVSLLSTTKSSGVKLDSIKIISFNPVK
jgi:hypothetical protein